MKTNALTPMEDAQIAHAFADQTDRFPMDQAIRQRGYEVTDRPNDGPVMWRPKGFRRIRFTQDQVIEIERLE